MLQPMETAVAVLSTPGSQGRIAACGIGPGIPCRKGRDIVLTALLCGE